MTLIGIQVFAAIGFTGYAWHKITNHFMES